MSTDLEQRICYLANQAKPRLSRNSYLLKILYYYQANPTLIPNSTDLAKLYHEINEDAKKCKFVLYIPMDYFIPINAVLLKCISSLHYHGLFLSRNKIMVLLFYSYISTYLKDND